MRHHLLAVILAFGTVSIARAQCPPSCPVPGGGSATTDCYAEFAGTGIRNNFPPYDPAKPKTAKELRCFDGDACDRDGEVNHSCQFDIDVCLHNADAALPACTPQDVTTAAVGKTSAPALAALQASINSLLPATTNVCTTGQSLTVPLKGPSAKELYKAARATVTVKVGAATGRDSDKLKLVCVPRDWPLHGYDQTNVHSTNSETVLSPANASQLVQKWNLPLTTGSVNGVTATPTVGFGLVYVASWNGSVYGVQASTGQVKWTYDTHTTFPVGVQSSPTVTADGRLIFGDADGRVHCLLAKTGELLWTNPVGGPIDHVWASPQVVAGRVFVGTASHTDNPCAPGYFHAFDLDTGALLWSHRTVPDKICNTDTTVECVSDADCGGTPGSCVAGCGAGVTATAAVSPDGATIYMATVGSFTFPSIGDSETVFAFDAANGSVLWKHRTQVGEQFSDGPPYHDWGFVNGPMLIQGDDGLGGTRPLLVASGKEGSLYALDPATGTPVWTHVFFPPPDFVGFGLFNGAIGWANHRIYAALYTTGADWPATNDHLFAFSDVDGATAWSAQIGQSWAHIALANGLVFADNNDTPQLFVHDAATGARLRTLTLPDTSSSGPSIVNGMVYVGYGIFGATGGVSAFGLP